MIEIQSLKIKNVEKKSNLLFEIFWWKNLVTTSDNI